MIMLTSFLYSFESLKWAEANKKCIKEGKRLPSLEELIKIRNILPTGLYWSETRLREAPSNFEYWIIDIKEDKSFVKGFLDENLQIKTVCIKGKRKSTPILDKKRGIKKFKAVYKSNVIVFPLGYLSFIGTPVHTIDNEIYPYNFWQFKIRLSISIDIGYMKGLIGKTIAYDTILMGEVLDVRPLDKYGYEYLILSTPTDLLSPYILPDEAIRTAQ